MHWTPRTKSIAFSAVVLAVATVLVAVGLVSANGILSPIREGRDWWQERSLTHHTRSLSVHVGSMVGENVGPVEDALVRAVFVPVFRDTEEIMARFDDPEPEPVFARTDPAGRVVFEVADAGPDDLLLYRVTVWWEEWEASEEFVLGEDIRVRLYFDEDGNGAWRWMTHRDLEEGKDKASLVVGIIDWRYCELLEDQGHTYPSVCGPSPPPAVAVHRVRDGVLAERIDGGEVEDGAVRFELHVGIYDVVVTYEGQELSERLHLACDWERMHEYNGSTLRLESQESCGGWKSGGEPTPRLDEREESTDHPSALS